MNTKRNILALLLIWLLTITNASATSGFPEEPMVIYGNITWNNINAKILKILDSNWSLLKQVDISDYKYWTNKTFEVNNKINLSPYNWALTFKIDNYELTKIVKGTTSTCESSSVFQAWNICEYNLTFSEIKTSTSGWGGGWWGYSSSSSSSSSSTTNDDSSDNDDDNNSSSTTSIKKTEKSNVKRNEEWKIMIKWSDYIKSIKTFNSNKKEEKKVLWLKVLNIKWDDSYNQKVTSFTKNIYSDIKLDSIRKSMIKYMDKMTTTYWMYTDSNLDDDLKETYKEKLKEDSEMFTLKLSKLKRKDEIIRYVLAKRELSSNR